MAIVSGIGILATAGFQLVVIRGLGPVEYGLLAAFLAFINVASIGSGALRNSVAVAVAEARVRGRVNSTRRLDGSTVEALVLGLVCALGVLLASSLLDRTQDTNAVALALVVAAVTPYFLFARAQGLLQGVGNSRSVVLWSTGAQVAVLGLSLVALALDAGAVGVLTAVLVVAVAGAVGSGIEARRGGVVTGTRVFSPDTRVVISLTIVFAWLTSVDVIIVRSGVDAGLAGAYAAAAVLVKTSLIVPGTLSLYLLPRFVSRRGDAAMTKLGVNVTLAVTFVGGLLVLGVVTLFGDVVVTIFGVGYEEVAQILPLLAIAWIPWAMAHGMLTRVTAVSSRAGLYVLVAVALAQWFIGRAVLPGVEQFIAFLGVLGVVALLALFVVHILHTRRDATPDARGPEVLS